MAGPDIDAELICLSAAAVGGGWALPRGQSATQLRLAPALPALPTGNNWSAYFTARRDANSTKTAGGGCRPIRLRILDSKRPDHAER
jgi:hypothetical protein